MSDYMAHGFFFWESRLVWLNDIVEAFGHPASFPSIFLFYEAPLFQFPVCEGRHPSCRCHMPCRQ